LVSNGTVRFLNTSRFGRSSWLTNLPVTFVWGSYVSIYDFPYRLKSYDIATRKLPYTTQTCSKSKFCVLDISTYERKARRRGRIHWSYYNEKKKQRSEPVQVTKLNNKNGTDTKFQKIKTLQCNTVSFILNASPKKLKLWYCRNYKRKRYPKLIRSPRISLQRQHMVSSLFPTVYAIARSTIIAMSTPSWMFIFNEVFVITREANFLPPWRPITTLLSPTISTLVDYPLLQRFLKTACILRGLMDITWFSLEETVT